MKKFEDYDFSKMPLTILEKAVKRFNEKPPSSCFGVSCQKHNCPFSCGVGVCVEELFIHECFEREIERRKEPKRMNIIDETLIKEMLVWNDCEETATIRTVVCTPSEGCFAYVLGKSKRDAETLIFWEHCKEIPGKKSVTLKEISEKFDIPLSKLSIVD